MPSVPIGLRATIRIGAGFCFLSFTGPLLAAKVTLDPGHWGNPAGEECVNCHTKSSAGLAMEWRESAHAKAGVNCLDCHQAEATDPDALKHEGQVIATIVSPQDCARCHEVCPAAQTGKDLSPKKVMATCAEFIAGAVVRQDEDALFEVQLPLDLLDRVVEPVDPDRHPVHVRVDVPEWTERYLGHTRCVG